MIEIFVRPKTTPKSKFERIELDQDAIDSFELTVSAQNLGNISVPGFTFTNIFKIPRSRANQMALGGLGVNGYDGIHHKRLLDCKMLIDGIEIITDGVASISELDAETFTMSVGKDAITLKSLLGDAKLKDLDFSELNHYLNYETFEQYMSNTVSDGFVYPAYTGPTVTGDTTQTTRQVYLDDMVPYIYLKYIWDKIFNNIGYTYKGDIFTNELFTKKIIKPPTSSITKSVQQHDNSIIQMPFQVLYKGKDIPPVPPNLNSPGEYKLPQGTIIIDLLNVTISANANSYNGYCDGSLCSTTTIRDYYTEGDYLLSIPPYEHYLSYLNQTDGKMYYTHIGHTISVYVNGNAIYRKTTTNTIQKQVDDNTVTPGPHDLLPITLKYGDILTVQIEVENDIQDNTVLNIISSNSTAASKLIYTSYAPCNPLYPWLQNQYAQQKTIEDSQYIKTFLYYKGGVLGNYENAFIKVTRNKIVDMNSIFEYSNVGQYEFVLDIISHFGLCMINEIGKKFKFEQLENVLSFKNNKTGTKSPISLSDCYCGIEKIEFVPRFGDITTRTAKFKYKYEDETAALVENIDGSFTIDNEQLNIKESDAYNTIFKYQKGFLNSNFRGGYEIDKNDNVIQAPTDLQLYNLGEYNITMNWWYSWRANNIPNANRINIQGRTYENLDYIDGSYMANNYYKSLKGVLDFFHLVTAEVHINAAQIVNLDQFKLHYIKQRQRWYYINRIYGFKGREYTCSMEMYEIPPGLLLKQ